MLWWTLRQLKSSSWEKRAEAAARLEELHAHKGAAALIEALRDDNATVRLAVIRALGALAHPAAAEPLAQAMADITRHKKDPRTEHPTAEYEAIALALGAAKGASVPPLLRLLDSEDKETRRWSAHALGLTGDARAVGPLVKRLSDSRSDARRAAALALGAIGDNQALDALIQALANRDPETRRAATIALGMIGSGRAADPLCAIAEDPNEPVQLAVIDALGKIGGLRAAEGLRAIIDGGKKSVREAASTALQSLKLAPATPEEHAAAAVLKGDFQSAAAAGEAAVGALVAAMSSKDPHRRAQAAVTLAILRPPSATEPLQHALNDHDAAVREAAVKALIAIGPASVAGLAGMISHPNPTVQSLAARALGEIGDPGCAADLAALIEQNPVVANEYGDMLDGLRAAAVALASILARRPGDVAAADLQRIAGLPDPRLQSATAPEVNCGQARQLAAQELQRRSGAPLH